MDASRIFHQKAAQAGTPATDSHREAENWGRAAVESEPKREAEICMFRFSQQRPIDRSIDTFDAWVG